MPVHDHVMGLQEDVERARAGDREACRRLVEATADMVYAVARRLLDDPVEAQDAAQDTFLRALRHLDQLEDPAAFPGWLRSIAIRIADRMRRRRRTTLVRLDEPAAMPALDTAEASWNATERAQLARALMTLETDERRICDRFYHGGWTTARLAEDAGITEVAMRKRLQRIRDRLREEIAMVELDNATAGRPQDLPERILDLLARPRLVDLPENPVGKVIEQLRVQFPYPAIELPEIIDLDSARTAIGGDPVYVGADSLHYIDERRILRYDLTLPLLLTARWTGEPLRLLCAGKVYRRERVSATHLEAFNQAEVLLVDERTHLDPWQVSGAVLRSMDALFPGREVRISRTEYPMCSQAWSLDAWVDDRWVELMAWGDYKPWVVRQLGADPERHIAIGAGYGLERMACLRYGIDDIRKVEAARIA
jgi:RNA polymerase sigma factor (sigma-70 family)